MAEVIIEVDGATLGATDDAPEGVSRGSIVALHAGVADRRVWAASSPAWVDAGWRVVSYDRRGFGTSEWEEGVHDPVADLVAVLDQTGVDRAVLVANSMGGTLALDTVVAAPDRVAGLVVVGSMATGQPWEEGRATEAELTLGRRIAAADETGDLDEVNRLEAHFWLDGPGAPEGRIGGAARSLFLAMNGRALGAPPTGDTVERDPAWDRLGDVAVPALFVVGELDETDAVVASRELAAAVPDAELIELPDRAHLPMLEDPAGFAQLVLAFLDRVA